ncbi:MAG TPA: iron-containing alcohol dehydrogenase [Pirellulales bacterium]|jgi:alcohol dehydrogenase class IV|nr:iron-containing alcohol dehydrogenase [Pirellulales bacterium]
MRTTWTFHSAGQLLFGSGAVAQLGALVKELSIKRLLLVTDRHLATAGVLVPVEAALGEAGIDVEVFDGGQPEPSLDLVDDCLALGRQFEPQGVLGLGGGSNMDLAKCVALVLTHGGTLRDYVGDSRVPGPVMPIVCVPTTAGTGSEVTAAAVLTDTANQVKVGVLSNYLRPRLALVDPRLTLSCPAKVTADSGIDALTHAIEAYTAVDNAVFPLPAGETSVYQGRHPLGDCLAEKAIALIGRHLVRAVREPANLADREGMALAATLAGLAFSNVGVALVHAMEYPVGGLTHCSHGAGNGLLLPFVMRFNLPERQAEFAAIARLLGEDTSGLSVEQSAERAIAGVERLKAEIGIPARLSDLGITAGQIPILAEKALAIKRILRVNPRPVSQPDIEQIFRWAL